LAGFLILIVISNWNICIKYWGKGEIKMTSYNHLKGEESPYLKQHMTNPVDWYPWRKKAFKKAKKKDLPIFLSIGYSTCHWCHVMEEESFTDQEIAEILNENLKVFI